jgi:acyl carrier protein phosphodiesterase
VSPASCHRDGTERAVEYVSRAKKIEVTSKPSVVKRVVSQQALREQFETAQKEIETLQAELLGTRVELRRTAEQLERSHAEIAANYFEYEDDFQVLQEVSTFYSID